MYATFATNHTDDDDPTVPSGGGANHADRVVQPFAGQLPAESIQTRSYVRIVLNNRALLTSHRCRSSDIVRVTWYRGRILEHVAGLKIIANVFFFAISLHRVFFFFFLFRMPSSSSSPPSRTGLIFTTVFAVHCVVVMLIMLPGKFFATPMEKLSSEEDQTSEGLNKYLFLFSLLSHNRVFKFYRSTQTIRKILLGIRLIVSIKYSIAILRKKLSHITINFKKI